MAGTHVGENKKEGEFSRFMLEYEITKESTKAQAKLILGKVKELADKGFKQVGITYSANHEQTIEIAKAYKEGRWKTEISGGAQAKVIEEIESLLETEEFRGLQHVFRILPISTCAHSGGKGEVDDAWLKDELDNIEEFLNEGGCVLGWQNQDTKNFDEFAIGGGNSKQLTREQKNTIQLRLFEFAIKYSKEESEINSKKLAAYKAHIEMPDRVVQIAKGKREFKEVKEVKEVKGRTVGQLEAEHLLRKKPSALHVESNWGNSFYTKHGETLERVTVRYEDEKSQPTVLITYFDPKHDSLLKKSDLSGVISIFRKDNNFSSLPILRDSKKGPEKKSVDEEQLEMYEEMADIFFDNLRHRLEPDIIENCKIKVAFLPDETCIISFRYGVTMYKPKMYRLPEKQEFIGFVNKTTNREGAAKIIVGYEKCEERYQLSVDELRSMVNEFKRERQEYLDQITARGATRRAISDTLKILNEYGGDWKFNFFGLFGPKHKDRMAAVKLAVRSCENINQIREILENQVSLFSAVAIKTTTRLDERWSQKGQLVNNKSGDYVACISRAIKAIPLEEKHEHKGEAKIAPR